MKNIFLFVMFAFIASISSFSQTSSQNDSTAVKKDSLELRYNFKNDQTGGLFLDYLAQKEIIFDKVLNKYVIVEKIGDYATRTPIYLTSEQYGKYRLKRDMLLYFKEKVSATSGKKKGAVAAQKNLLPTYYVNSKFFETVFGSNAVEVIPTGNLNLKLGFTYQNTENPQISEENRSNFTFDFDQQINASIQAKVGTRLQFTANYDTQASFDFQNLVKIEFLPLKTPDVLKGVNSKIGDLGDKVDGYKDRLSNKLDGLTNKVDGYRDDLTHFSEDGIIQGIEAGNISMPIKNSLINGAQSLFGVKTDLKFGHTNITAVFSQQNSESRTVTSEGGASIQPFELRATDYDTDRHFFLSQYFVDNYAKSLAQYPLISSQINITRIEVWITNRNASTDDFRSIVAFADLGEVGAANLANRNPLNITPNADRPFASMQSIPSNNTNNISALLTQGSAIRDVGTLNTVLSVTPYNMEEGRDYSLLQNARKLQENEYTLNPQLGFISLNRRLNDGEVLAVAYEYTVAGNVRKSDGSPINQNSFKVGEFSNDGIQAPNNLAVKLLRSEVLTTKREDGVGGFEQFPTWRLMMKNVYALGAYPLSQEGFRFEIQYRDDATGIPSNTLQNAQTPEISGKPLLQVLRLDQLDQSQFRDADGYFDYVEGITVNSQDGMIFFPEPEPFGSNLDDQLTNQIDKDNFVFNELYLDTKINIKNNYQNKDKFFLKGYFKSENSGGIPIGAFNVPRGSVKVTAGGRQLVEGVDYVVDYLAGKVQIIDPGLQASGVPISVSTENNAVFNQQRKTFMGVDVEHRFSDDFVLGATILNVEERPLTPKVNFGSEPINNTMLGLNVDYATEVPFFTKLANKLPFIDTDVPSNLSVRADMAYLLPGTPGGIDVAGAATSYIDDFEASQVPISLLSPLQWYLASTPKNTANDIFNGDSNTIEYNYKRAKLAWYTIDQVFYGLGATPPGISADDLSRAETRQINFRELFPNQQLDITQNSLIRTLDLAYFPQERGSYNFDTGVNVNPDGTFKDPETRWAGITRPLTTNNFEQANVEYIQFWLMDPYENYSITTEEGLPEGLNWEDAANQVGDLYLNLGNISEDINKDNRKMYENGLPEIGGTQNTTPTLWGKVPTNPSIIYAFSEEDAARANQDLGFDGLSDKEEISKATSDFNITSAQITSMFRGDPASDNFQFFRGGSLDTEGASVIKRYKNFNNTQGNSPTINQSQEAFPTASTSYPDVEDINRDQTMNTIESYFQYKISMNKADLVKGTNFIVDEKSTSVTLENGNTQTTKWYQFRVPIRSGTPINGISDFNSIRFMRMFVSGFKMPVVLRFGELDLVRGDWRRYVRTLDPNINPDRALTQNELNDFEVGVVNIEQNEGRYVLPPGILRERLQGSTSVQQQNEQSVTLKVSNLQPNTTRAIYKNISVDLRRFKQLKMFMHLEELKLGSTLSDGDMAAIIRLGTDLNDNFYEIEIPLKVTADKATSALDIWPEENNLDVALESLGKIKLERDVSNASINELYTATSQDIKVSVKGNPTLAQVRTIVLGLKNIATQPKSGEIWFNELRSAGFDDKGGWAAVVNADANFADVANVSLSGSIQTLGFGNLEDRVNQRSLDETKEYNFATTVQLGSVLTPKNWGLQLPMSYSIGEQFIDPKFDPQYQDVALVNAIKQNPNSEFSRDYTKRTSISFNNVKKNRNPGSEKKPQLYDVENISVSYAHNKEFHKDYNIEKYLNENVTASAAYNFNFQSKGITPFKNLDSLTGKYWQLLKDFNFNLVPNSLAVNSRINRQYSAQQSRNLVEGLSAQPELTQRRFLFDWDYAIGFDLTKSIRLNFNATNSHIYDAFGSGEDLKIFDNFFNTGRPNKYHQKLNGTYKLPIDKIPFLDFVKADYAYTADFDWQVTSQDNTINEKIGNVIQNANTHNLNSTFNFDKFYKKLGFEKLLLKKSQRKRNARSGANIQGVPRGVANSKKLPLGKQILKGVYDVVTSVKNGRVSYSENNGQLLPGYDETVGFLGGAPTSFAFGSQVDIRNKALINGWLINPRDPDSTDPDQAYFNKTYRKTHYNKLDYSFTLKPFKDLNIDVVGNKIQTRDLQQQLDVIVDTNNPSNPFGILDYRAAAFETGNFSTSYAMIGTSFSNGDALFQKMKDYRGIVADRLATERGLPVSGFGENSQQVLLPAFMAAYSGSNPEKVNTGLFRTLPIPNWTLRYNGFMKKKWFQKNFSTFVVSHGYRSSYTVSSFTNNLQYSGDALNPNMNAAKNYEPELLVSAVTLVDEFSPLLKSRHENEELIFFSRRSQKRPHLNDELQQQYFDRYQREQNT